MQVSTVKKWQSGMMDHGEKSKPVFDIKMAKMKSQQVKLAARNYANTEMKKGKLSLDSQVRENKDSKARNLGTEQNEKPLQKT